MDVFIHVQFTSALAEVVKALCYKLEGRWFETPMRWMNFFNLPNSSGCIMPWGYSASNRNVYQKQKSNSSGEQSGAGA
jgi:hypothetical protein